MSLLAPEDRRSAVGDDELAACRRDPRRAVRDQDIVCLVCGIAFRQLTNTHIRSHGMRSIEYKLAYGYNLGRPLMSHSLRRLYAERAVRVKLAERIRRRPIVEHPELRRGALGRPVPLEGVLTRQEVQRRPRKRWAVRDGIGRFWPRPAASGASEQTQLRAEPGGASSAHFLRRA